MSAEEAARKIIAVLLDAEYGSDEEAKARAIAARFIGREK